MCFLGLTPTIKLESFFESESGLIPITTVKLALTCHVILNFSDNWDLFHTATTVMLQFEEISQKNVILETVIYPPASEACNPAVVAERFRVCNQIQLDYHSKTRV